MTDVKSNWATGDKFAAPDANDVAANLNTLTALVAAAYSIGGADVAIVDGGTGASSAPTARANLGVLSTAEVSAAISTAFSTFVAGSPGILDTWLELVALIQADDTALNTLTTLVATKYIKPDVGIPSTDLIAAVQASLSKADSAIQPAALTTAVANLTGTAVGYPTEAAGGIVGENGYGTDILFDAGGNIVTSTLVRWLTRLNALGVPKAVDSTWYGAGFVGENGYATELITDLKGLVPLDVLTAWAQRMPAKTVVDAATVILPSTLYLVAGQTYRLEYAKIIAAWNPSFSVTVTGPESSTVGHGNYGAYWQYSPAAATTFTLSITVTDRTGTTITSATRPVVVF